MNPGDAIQGAARTLTLYQRMQEVAANNIANSETAGFKFDRVLAQASRAGDFSLPQQVTDLQQGALARTGRELDVALDGDGFLVVQTPRGERLTRGGSLKLDAAGQLTESDGSPLLGQKGPIVVPPGELAIEPDGTVRVDGDAIDQLRVERAPKGATLQKEGVGRFTASAPTVRAEGTVVRQGQLEDSNFDSMTGMLDLVLIQRAYSANVDALKAMDGVLHTVAGDVGRV